ncbi:MAG: hypothetical protein SGI72_04160 [Planctomycetota bacterium]|nr:hypothetical protein [Planctomycetota bacterium]
MIRTCWIWFACACLVRFAAAAGVSRMAEIELVGPLANVVIEARGGGETRIEGELQAGETRLVVVPIAFQELSSATPTIRFDDDPNPLKPRGSARFVAWRASASPLSELSPGLRARARPALAATPIEISRAASLVLLAAAIGVLYLRKKPAVALAVALVAALTTLPLVRAPVRALEATVTLVDGDVNETRWRRIDAALDQLTLADPNPNFELACDPPDARLAWRTALDVQIPARVLAHGARLFATRVVAVEEGVLTRESNHYAAFDEIWLREEGEWRRGGPWNFGAPLPRAGEPRDPPAWLASSLPQGISILVARVSPGPGRPPSFVRVSGF